MPRSLFNISPTRLSINRPRGRLSNWFRRNQWKSDEYLFLLCPRPQIKTVAKPIFAVARAVSRRNVNYRSRKRLVAEYTEIWSAIKFNETKIRHARDNRFSCPLSLSHSPPPLSLSISISPPPSLSLRDTRDLSIKPWFKGSTKTGVVSQHTLRSRTRGCYSINTRALQHDISLSPNPLSVPSARIVCDVLYILRYIAYFLSHTYICTLLLHAIWFARRIITDSNARLAKVTNKRARARTEVSPNCTQRNIPAVIAKVIQDPADKWLAIWAICLIWWDIISVINPSKLRPGTLFIENWQRDPNFPVLAYC